MRSTTLLRHVLGIDRVVVMGAYVEQGSLIVKVRPRWRLPRCALCGRTREDRACQVVSPNRRWRHLDLAGIKLFLEFDRKRVPCRYCGWSAEKVPWADEPSARFTRDFDEMVTFQAKQSDKTAVAELLRITWRTVGRCIQRVVARLEQGDPLDSVRLIGVDEISYRKHHNYLTVVTDHERGKIIWAKEGRNAETLKAFFLELGEERSEQIEAVTVDLCAPYISAVRAMVPHAELTFDRFHVQRLVSDALDETRREEWRRLRASPEEASAMKKTRWALLKHPEKLTDVERLRLARIQRDNKRLYRAYLLKEQFVELLNRRQPNVVARLLKAWLAWASRSRLPAFVKAARTIRKHTPGILAYIRSRLTNGLVEGLNTKARLITRRAYGFHSAEAVIAMIKLCCSDLQVHPPHKTVA